MKSIRIAMPKGGGSFSVSASPSGFNVRAKDVEDAALAEAAQLLIAGRWKRNAYSPAMGDPLAFAAAMAASILGGKVTTTIPAGSGELEQSGDYGQ